MMKRKFCKSRIVLSIIVVLLFVINASAQITDDFTDGEFSSNPSWTGDDSVFIVVNNQLRSNKELTNSTFYLSTASTQSNNLQWEFYLNLKFATSGSNYVDVFLMADQSNLKSTNLNGYFVRVGGTADNVTLFKKVNGTNTAIITGVASLLTSSSNNVLKIKVIRDAANNFSLYREFSTGSLSGNYTLEGTINDVTFTSSSFFGISITQSTASFFLKHFFDDLYIGPIILDNTPPQLQRVTPISSTQLDVLFNEAIDPASASLANNYSILGIIGNPSSAVPDAINSSLVHLTFTNSFVVGQNYFITVTGVKDAALNTMTSQTLPFTYIVTEPANSRDVVINEIYADNTSTLNSTDLIGHAEYVELYNRSNKYISLSGWKFFTGGSTRNIQPKIMAPNSYMVLVSSADTTYYQIFGQTAAAALSLTNAGMSLTLRDNTGAIIDRIIYADSWYQDNAKKDGGYSLERINPNDTCFYQNNNWKASNSSLGGTPGVVNTINSNVIDNAGPVAISSSILAINKIRIGFNEGVDSATAAIVGNYSFSGGALNLVNADAVGPENLFVDYTFSSPLDTGIIYQMTLRNLTDCKGNVTTTSNISFSIYKPAKPYEIVIHEIMAKPEPAHGLPAWEYLELYNRSSLPKNIKNIKLIISSTTKTLPDYVMQPNSYLLITDQDALSQFGISNAIGLSSLSLTDGGTTISLKDTLGNIIHHVKYSSDWFGGSYKADGGWSLEMVDVNNPCGEEENWKPSTNPNGGTPGLMNSVQASNPDNNSPELIRVSIRNNRQIQLYFNETLDSLSARSTQRYTIDNGVGNPTTVDIVEPDFRSVILNLQNVISPGIKYVVTVNSIVTDCVGNPITTENTAPFQLPETVAPQDLVINEVLFNPYTDGVDFVELYNRSNKTIDLKEIRLSSFDTIANVLESVELIAPDGFLMFPDDYVVLTTKPKVVANQYQAYNTINKKGFVQMEQLPSFNNADGRVVISDYSDNIIDRLYYDESMHFPLLNDPKGVSLERISPERSSQDNDNWHSAAESKGFATPTLKNSQYTIADANAEVSISPEVFSPDNDGFQDILSISYTFEKPGYIATIEIFDAAGRPIKTLKANELLGSSGTFSWDGVNNNNEKVRIGPYIILFSAYHKDGDTKKIKKSCVVASRL